MNNLVKALLAIFGIGAVVAIASSKKDKSKKRASSEPKELSEEKPTDVPRAFSKVKPTFERTDKPKPTVEAKSIVKAKPKAKPKAKSTSEAKPKIAKKSSSIQLEKQRCEELLNDE